MSMNILISSLILSFTVLVPIGIKWELEKKIVLPAALCIGIFAWAVVKGINSFVNLSFYHSLSIQVLVIGAVATSLLLWRFFRDPERVPPDNDNAILSPADGRIIYVKKIENGEIPFSEKNGKKFPLHEFVQSDVLPSMGYLVGIAMTWLDVHVNRSPIGGKITLLKHIKGLFISLKKKEAVIRNERVLTVIENGHLKLGMVQIASRLVRNIIPFTSEGSEIRLGQRIGVIRFGSQVDLVLPDLPSIEIKVSTGEKVTAGVSIVATFDMTHHPLR